MKHLAPIVILAAALAGVLANGCASIPTYSGTFVGRAEKMELRSWDGKAYPVTVFTVEKTKGRIRISSSGRKWGEPMSWERCILVDGRLTAYPTEKYAGKRLEVDGRMEAREVHPYPGGPDLYEVLPNGHRLHLQNVLIVRSVRVEIALTGQDTDTVRGVKVGE